MQVKVEFGSIKKQMFTLVQKISTTSSCSGDLIPKPPATSIVVSDAFECQINAITMASIPSK